jgi:hypothetical protein
MTGFHPLGDSLAPQNMYEGLLAISLYNLFSVGYAIVPGIVDRL